MRRFPALPLILAATMAGALPAGNRLTNTSLIWGESCLLEARLA